MRKPISSPSKDDRIFSRTAVQSKRININPTLYRGGIRL